MKRFDLFKILKEKGYVGVDVSLKIALFDYGLIVKEESEELHAIYSVGDSKFDHGWITKRDIDDKINESWFDKDSFLSFVGSSEVEWLEMSYMFKLGDLIKYYGYDNIMGTAYSPLSLMEVCKLAKNLKGGAE